MGDLYPPHYGYGGSSYPSASAMMRERHYHSPQVVPEPPSEPMSVSSVILPPRVEEEIRAERRERANMFSRAAGYHDLRRPLTDDECIDRYGDTVAGLKGVVAILQARAARLTKRRQRKERLDVQAQLARAITVCEEALRARVVDPPSE